MRTGLIILTCCLPCVLWSQPDLHLVGHYAIKDGLSNTAVYCIREDSRGFLWLGTKEGLNRFDGFQFKKYFAGKNHTHSLPHNKVFDILEYQPGMLLIATGNGLAVLNTITGQFTNDLIKFGPLRAGSGVLVSSLYQDPEENIWINHNGKLDVFDSSLNHLYCFTDLEWASTLSGIAIYHEDWYTDRKGRLWLPADTSGLQIIDFAAKKILNKKNNPARLPYLRHAYIRSFLIDETDNTLWLAPWSEGLIKYDLTSGDFTQLHFNISIPDEQRSINSIVKTGHQTLIFSINGRCLELNMHTLEYAFVPGQYMALSEPPSIHAITTFATGDSYWIGAFEGLFQIQAQGDKMEMLLHPSGQSTACADIILAESGTLFSIHNNDVLLEVDSARQGFRYYAVPVTDPGGLTELAEDHEHRVWIGSTKGIAIFDRVSKSFQQPSFLPSTLTTKVINVLHCDRTGDMWIATRDPFELFRYTHSTGQTQKIENDLVQQFGQLGERGRISIIVEDEDGSLWMTSRLGGGILRYQKDTGAWTLFPTGNRYYHFLASKGILSVQPGEQGQLWLSTVVGDGLICYDYLADTIIRYTREDGLLSDYVQIICPDHDDNLWLATEYGVTQFNKAEKRVTSNTPIDHWSVIGEPYFAVHDPMVNQLVYAHADRHLFVSLNKRLASPPTPVPLLDRILVNNKEQRIDPHRPFVRLQHTQKNISMDFTVAHFSNADKLRFAYFLKGADHEWNYTSVNRSAHYAILAPGDYTFAVMVADESGVWGSSNDILSFTIVPPFWKSIWFLLCLFATLALCSILLMRRRIQTIRYEAGLKQKIAETEMMALRAQMNPHFIFNCINSIDALIQNDDKYHATVYLNKFARLIRNILDSSKQNTVTLEKDLETLKLYIELEQFRNENKFNAEVTADPSLLQDDFKVPPLIIQPYVENAILHGLRNRMEDGGKLSVSLKRLNGEIQYTIEDNGVGRKYTMNGKATEKISYGMQMSEDRIKLFNQEQEASVVITDLMNERGASGTRVEVLLKIV